MSIRFKWHGVTICVANSHLAAHDKHLDDRIEDFLEIIDENKFNIKMKLTIFEHEYYEIHSIPILIVSLL